MKRRTYAKGSIKTDTGERGWIPAWYIGKLDSATNGGDSSNPSTATMSAAPRSAESGNSGETVIAKSANGPPVESAAGQEGDETGEGEVGKGYL